MGAVPVVWGAPKEDYETVVPPHSCVFVDDFAQNTTELAAYLRYLDQNETAYREYLQWRLLPLDRVFGYKQPTVSCVRSLTELTPKKER